MTASASVRLEYPATPQGDVVEEYHGTEIRDPYRWLEDTDAPATRRWIEAQNALSERWFDEVARGRGVIREHVRRRWDHPRRGAPWRRGEHWFQLRNSGLQEQDVLFVMGDPDGDGRVLLDPNELSETGTVALTGASVSDDGALLAYATSSAGSDWKSWRVREVETGRDLPDVVEWSKFSSAAWHPDGSGFYYGWYAPPPAGAAYDATNENQKLRFHRLGTDQAKDPVVHERPDHPDWGFEPSVTHDGRFLVLHVWKGTHPENQLHYVDLDADGGAAENAPVVALVDDFDAHHDLVGTDGDVWYVLTDRGASRRRILAVDVRNPEPPREVVPETDDILERARLVAGRLVCVYLHDASHRVVVADPASGERTEVPLPELGTVESLTGRELDHVVHLTHETFTHPKAVLRHDLDAGTTAVSSPPGIDPPAGRFATEQVFVTAEDGTRIPLFLVRRADVEPTGDAPTILWGYGGFQIPVTPAFRVAWSTWVDLGGMLAVACLRGGGEYGREWHDAGRLANKQNVFDDFVACAEWLDASPWTSREHIGIEGRSNGGLLVGACMTQRPDLFASCVPEVGVLDMLRFHRFTIGWAWVSDYGSADEPDQFPWLLGYSPLHNVRAGECYPPTLVTTGDHDDRVVPGHSFKFAAALQAAQGCANPVLVRIDTSAGHGVGKPVSKLVDERADVLAFHATILGLDIAADGDGRP